METKIPKPNFFKSLFGIKTASKTNEVKTTDKAPPSLQKINTYCDAIVKIWSMTFPVNKENIRSTGMNWKWTSISEFRKLESPDLYNLTLIQNGQASGSLKIALNFSTMYAIEELTGLKNIQELVFHTLAFFTNTYQTAENGNNLKWGEISNHTWDVYLKQKVNKIACFEIKMTTTDNDSFKIWFLMDLQLLIHFSKIDEKLRANPDEVYILEMTKKAMEDFKKQQNKDK